LRPYPGAAEGVKIRQVGNRIELEWRAPTRNTDGTTEKLELAEVEVRRRIVDIAALIEEQTKVIEPPDPPDSPDPEEEAETEEAETEDLETEEPETETEERPTTLPSEPVPSVPSLRSLNDVPTLEGPVLESPGTSLVDEPQEPQAPPVPMLQILDFAPESRYLATLESTEPGETVTFVEDVDPIWVGQRLEYAVVYANQSNRRGERSTTVEIEPIATLVAPEQPSTETGDGHVMVRWDRPGPDTYFSVFRRAESAPDYPDLPLNAVPIVETEFEDRSVTFDVSSCYMVRTVSPPPPPPPVELELAQEAVAGDAPLEPETELVPEPQPEPEPDSKPEDEPEPKPQPEPDSKLEDEPEPEPEPEPETKLELEPDSEPEDELEDELEDEDAPSVIVPVVPPLKNTVRIESVGSPEFCLVPVDTFAPPAPTGLVAVRSGEDVLLTWTEVERVDVTGYRVYRAGSEEGPFVPLAEEVLRVPSFSDESVASGQTYYYAVTAVDDAPLANESERSELSEVTFRR